MSYEQQLLEVSSILYQLTHDQWSNETFSFIYIPTTSLSPYQPPSASYSPPIDDQVSLSSSFESDLTFSEVEEDDDTIPLVDDGASSSFETNSTCSQNNDAVSPMEGMIQEEEFNVNLFQEWRFPLRQIPYSSMCQELQNNL